MPSKPGMGDRSPDCCCKVHLKAETNASSMAEGSKGASSTGGDSISEADLKCACGLGAGGDRAIT
eukprot:CAMPEP_0171747636 /NCGR_PEP_ID=MMETSP0991-20121206/39588_1 /TAXON_ID=483369 /ORGANISM="non described non described, Strain CCMP2098" /LENGTH=64 /DNA_ID=CAMNT_0012347765 /DNA_START=710 /DNA_END=904 /DNA_ORIENTATION=-